MLHRLHPGEWVYTSFYVRSPQKNQGDHVKTPHKPRWAERDGRGFFWALNELYDRYAPRLGAVAFAVYMALCRHAGNDLTCQITLRFLGKRLRLSVDTVRRAM